MRSSTWLCKAIRSFCSAWSWMSEDKSLASKRNISSSFDSGKGLFSLAEFIEISPTFSDESKSVSLLSLNKKLLWLTCSSLSHELPTGSSQWFGEGIGVIWLGTGETLLFLHTLCSFAFFRYRLRSAFSTRFDFFLTCFGRSGELWSWPMGLAWPGGGVDCDWSLEGRGGGDRNPVSLACTILQMFVTRLSVHTQRRADIMDYGISPTPNTVQRGFSQRISNYQIQISR